MSVHWLNVFKHLAPASRRAVRWRRGRRPTVLEALEDRVLLATVYTVNDTSGNPADVNSLPHAIAQANANPSTAGSVIEFSSAFFSSPHTIVLTATLGLSESGGPETIEGPDSAPLTISGGGSVQVFNVASGVTASLSFLTISDGVAMAASGGGVLNAGLLSMTHCSVTGNTVNGGAGAGTYEGGGIYSTGSLTVTHCTIAGNTVTGGTNGGQAGGGGIGSTGPLLASNCAVTGNAVSGTVSSLYGGGIDSTGTSNVTDCKITGNSLTDGEAGGGVFNNGLSTLTDCTIADNSISSGTGAGIANAATMTVLGCAIFDNSANSFAQGGGIANNDTLAVADSAITGNSATVVAGGILNASGTTFISNSTIAGNAAAGVGGILVAAGSLTAANVTIAENSSGVTTYQGYSVVGGIEIILGAATLDNSIVALNTAANAPSDIAVNGGGQLTAASGYNLIGTGGSGGLVNGTSGNQVGVANPGLAPLASNGGPTQTIALLPGSPAIDAGSNALAINPTNNHALIDDQRESSFPRIYNGTVDIGAYELQASATVSTVAVGWGTQTAALQTAADGVRLLPTGRNRDLPWLGIRELFVGFQEPAELTASDVTIQGVRRINSGPVTVTGSGETFTIAFPQPVQKADRITIKISGPGFTPFTRRLDILPGDIGDFGVVKQADVKLIRADIKGAPGAPPTILGDIYGTGTVNASDLNYVRRHLGAKLP
jgi:hypothetical protein